MARFNLTRVIFVMAVALTVVGQASWFGDDEEEEQPTRRRRERREVVEDTVEYDPTYEQARRDSKRSETEPEFE